MNYSDIKIKPGQFFPVSEGENIMFLIDKMTGINEISIKEPKEEPKKKPEPDFWSENEPWNK